MRLLFWALILSSLCGVARAEPPCENAVGGHDYSSRLYRVSLNQMDLDGTYLFLKRRCGALLVRESDLNDWRLHTSDLPGVQLDGEVYINFSEYPGVELAIDRKAQKLIARVPPERFAPVVVDLGPVLSTVRPAGNWAAFLNWGVGRSWRKRQELTSIDNGSIGLGLMFPKGVLTSEWFGARSSDGFSSTIRTGTRYERDDIDRNLRYTLGDFNSAPSTWGVSYPVAGFQVRRNFTTTPGIRVTPVSVMRFLLDAPTRVLGVNTVGHSSADKGNLVFGSTEEFPAGELRFVNMPHSQNGQYRMSLFDRYGNEAVAERNYYFNQGLIKRGLHDFSLGVGLRRHGLGNDYSDVYASATDRYGVTSNWTLEGHLELGEDEVAIGATTLNAIPYVGVVTGTLAASSSNRTAKDGLFAGLSIENRYHRFSYALGVEQASDQFVRPYQVLPGAELTRYYLSAGLTLPKHSSISFSYAEQLADGTRTSAFVSGSASWRFTHSRYLTFRATKDIHNDTDLNVGVTLSVPLSDVYSWLPGVREPKNYNSLFGKLSRTRINATTNLAGDSEGTAPLNIGTGQGQYANYWSAGYSTDLLNLDRHKLGVNAGTQYGEVNAAVSIEPKSKNASIGANGGIVFAGGDVHLTRRIHSAMALVRLGKQGAGARVSGLKANRNGNVLVPNLNAYHANRLKLDPRDLPLNAEIPELDIFATPRYKNMAIVEAPVQFTRNVLAKLVMPSTSSSSDMIDVPVGAMVSVSGLPAKFIVGFGGEVYIEGLPDSDAVLTAEWLGGRCKALVVNTDVKLAAGEIPEIGPYVCED